MNHEEKAKKYYPEYNKVGENFKSKQEWPKAGPVKMKGCKIKILIGIILGIIIGAGLLTILVESGSLENHYTKASNLNESYLNGTRDAAINIMEYTRTTGTTFIIVNNTIIQLQCGLPQNITNAMEVNK